MLRHRGGTKRSRIKQKINLIVEKAMTKKTHAFKQLAFGAKFQKESGGDRVFVRLSPTQYAEITTNDTSSILCQSEATLVTICTNFDA